MINFSEIGYYKLYTEVQNPVFQTKYSACFDIPAFLDKREQVLSFDSNNHQFEKELILDENKQSLYIKIKPFERIMIPTGLIFCFNCMYSMRVHSRSGLSLKKGLVLANQEGVIDCDYNKQLYVCILNLTNVEQRIYNQDRIAQGEIVANMHEIDSMVFVNKLEAPLELGDRKGGFGSTGV